MISAVLRGVCQPIDPEMTPGVGSLSKKVTDVPAMEYRTVVVLVVAVLVTEVEVVVGSK